jgi:hypothetical protein
MVPQPNGNPNIDALDGRLTQALQHADPGAGGAGAVWTQHTSSGAGGRTVVTWFELVPGLCSGGTCPSSAKRQEGILSDPNLYLFNAAISPTSHGDAAVIEYNSGSAADFVDVRSQSRDAAEPLGTMSGELTLRSSSVPDNDFSCTTPYGPPCRWGDYSGISPDPMSCSAVWGTNMLTGNIASSGNQPAWVTQNFELDAGAVRSTASVQQYRLTASDGQTWNDVDSSQLRLGVSPCSDSNGMISANADLFTATPGVNQDLGIFVDIDGVASTRPLAWKESGGFNGAFSPNAAYVQAPFAMPSGHIYTVRFKWKTNTATTGSIFMGAGPLGDGTYSPSRLTIQFDANTPASSRSTSQPKNVGSDGSTWRPIPGVAPIALNPSADSRAVIGANADLWTDTPGLNQDIGISVSGGLFGAGTLVAWKESGGFNGTFSPNAAFVQVPINLVGAQAYLIQVVWKTNHPAPASASIYAGAGPLLTGDFSPTSLTATVLPTAATLEDVVITTQPSLPNSDGATWWPLGPQAVVNPTLSLDAIVSANADLWTATSGFNQDLAIFVSDNGGPSRLIAWKESGGFGGTLSPNAAFVETVVPMTQGHSYMFSLRWKTNRASGATIYSGAGPINSAFSPTRLSVIAQG